MIVVCLRAYKLEEPRSSGCMESSEGRGLRLGAGFLELWPLEDRVLQEAFQCDPQVRGHQGAHNRLAIKVSRGVQSVRFVSTTRLFNRLGSPRLTRDKVLTR